VKEKKRERERWRKKTGAQGMKEEASAEEREVN